jgi:demethylmenaquinone methyltransferase/2-methoxy-6-polyprenyl-1,4-benzoquinol methylase
MFDAIAFRYDLLNHLLSMGIDKKWRKKALDMLGNELGFFHFRQGNPVPGMPVDAEPQLLDLATGTGDFILDMARRLPYPVTGVDLSHEMLGRAEQKIKKKGLENVTLMTGDAENLPFPDKVFDAVTIGFGVRNFQDLEKGLAEIYRVLKTPGIMVILEFSRPNAFLIKNLYHLYFYYLLPLVGRIISGDPSAYKYLPQSVYSFPEQPVFLNIAREAGFSFVKAKPLSFGIVTVYLGIKSF